MNPTGQIRRVVALVMAFAVLALVVVPPIATTVSAAEPSPLATLGYSVFLGHNFAPASTTPSAVRVFTATINETFLTGDIVSYRGHLYEVMLDFTFYGDPNWHPGIMSALWRIIGECNSYTTPPPPTPGGRQFVPRVGEVFHYGEIIFYNGVAFRVLQPFTFYGDPNWHPGIMSALWARVGAGVPLPPPTPTPPGHEPSDEPSLFIVTYGGGSVFTERVNFAQGEEVLLTVIPDRGYYLVASEASVGTLYHDGRVTFSYTMPNVDATLTFTFVTAESDPLKFTYPGGIYHTPVLTKRDFSEEDIMESDRYPGFFFVRGEVIVIAYDFVDYAQMTELVAEHGGEIVGFLEVANVYQLYFTNADTEAELLALIELFNNHAFAIISSLNGVSEIEIGTPVVDREDDDIINDPPIGFESFFEPFTAPPSPYIRPNTARDRDMLIPSDYHWRDQWFIDGLVGGPNWGMEAMNAPRAWHLLFDEYMNLHDHVEMVNVGVIDSMFANHVDLDITLFENRLPESEQPFALSPFQPQLM